MPFGESQAKVYVTIFEGMLAVRSSESDSKAVKRELKTGHIIYERRYKSLTGRIKEIFFRTNDYNGKKWEELAILIYDGQDHYQLSMPFPGKYSLSFLRAIKNADLSKDIQFNPWTKTVNDKVKAALYMNQGNAKESIPWYFTMETPNGLPELVPYTVPGSEETKWSDVERNKFLKAMVEKELVPQLAAIWHSGAMPAAATMPPEVMDADGINEPGDDLPF